MKLSKLASEIAESPTFALNEEARLCVNAASRDQFGHWRTEK